MTTCISVMLPRSARVTAPAFSAPEVECQVIERLGESPCISASHSFSIGPILAFQCRLFSPDFVTDSTCFIKEGKFSQSVHREYTSATGALIVRSFSTRIKPPADSGWSSDQVITCSLRGKPAANQAASNHAKIMPSAGCQV